MEKMQPKSAQSWFPMKICSPATIPVESILIRILRTLATVVG
jgi:hypothetical protein